MKRNYWRWIFAGMAATLLVAMPLLSLDAGNSGDEDLYQIPQGNYVLDYYGTLGRDTTCLGFENLKYYGASFDVATAFVNRVCGVDDIHVTRHVFNSLFGWLAIIFAGLAAVRIGGWRAGVMTMAMLFLSPRFLGHAYNNPKDTPFAAAVMMGCYFLLRFFQQFPDVKKRTVVFLSLSIALAISIRIGGLILFGYFGIFCLAYLVDRYFTIRRRDVRPAVRGWKGDVLRLSTYALIICTAGYFAGLILWPYALQSPFAHPLRAFREMSHFEIALGQIFEGYYTLSNNLPWYYTPKYILLTVPPVVLAGAAIFVIAGGLKRASRLATFMICFVAVFPVFWIVYTNANVYGGWRHAMFAYPPMVVAAGLGFNALAQWAGNRYLRMALTALPFALLIAPAAHIVRNHPYEYIYFNTFAGGIDKVYGNYEMDYYYHSTRAATEWLRAHAEKSGLEEGDKIVVGSWHASVQYFLRHDTARFESVFMRWSERGAKDWDYAIFPVTGIMPQMIKSPHFPPQNTVHTVTVDGKPVCIVLRCTDKSAYWAALARNMAGDCPPQQRNILNNNAFTDLRQAYEADPYNDFVLIALSDMYLSVNKIDSSLYYVNKLVEYYPDENNLNYIANLYEQYTLRTKNRQYAEQMIAFRRRMVADFPHEPVYYYNLAMLYVAKEDPIAGKKLMDLCMKRNGYMFNAYYYMALYLANTGNRDAALDILNKCMVKFPASVPALQKVLTPIR
ncbi:MAG: hypothetical protein LBJ23_02355 [Tannerella sp.]|jgi:tetratricopeptide (TPR) repeat protein|nr:hypothetical protein [Tannerella sp.]